jgi:hypothetical protein
MKTLLATVAILAATIAATAPASAGCSCQCVNGQMQALCTSSMDIRPMCMGMCGMAPPSIAPIAPMRMAPLGTSSCSMQQVQNRFSGRYEWQQVCR